MATRDKHKQFHLIVLSIILFAFSSANYALPFSITPKAGTTLPTQIKSEQTLSAFYTIANNTIKVRSGNYIKYLPPNVSQVTFDNTISDLCGSSFTLQASGTAGNSCTLELNVTGKVNSNDPNPHHHLFACLADGVSCAGTQNPLNISLDLGNLITVGTYLNNDVEYPGIVTGNLQGTAWNQQILTLPSSITSGFLFGLSCAGDTCVAVGDYIQNYNDNVTGIARSTDGGNTWTQQVLIPPNGYVGSLNGISCINNTCIAAGAFRSSTTQFGIANSNDGGNTWSQQVLPLYSFYVSGSLYSISCSGSTCVGVGRYEDNRSVTYAGIAYSADSGNNWSQTVLPLPINVNFEYLYGVSCNGTLCVAAGELDTNSGEFPSIAVSTNGGSAWTQTALTLPSPYEDGILNAISCTASYCIAVGNYDLPGGSDAPNYPAIAMTIDNGMTWTQQVLTSLPSGFTSGAFYGVECTDTTCVATGTLQATNDTSSPAIAISTNSGNTWSLQALTNPAGFSQAALAGVS